MECLNELVEWVPAKAIEPSMEQLLRLVCHLLTCQSLSICLLAADCLLRFADRKVPVFCLLFFRK